jgi:hypothetical protein
MLIGAFLSISLIIHRFGQVVKPYSSNCEIFTKGGTPDVLNPSIQGAMSDLRSIRTGGSPEGDTYYIILH